MKPRGLGFRTPLARLVLDDKKDVTRRLVRLPKRDLWARAKPGDLFYLREPYFKIKVNGDADDIFFAYHADVFTDQNWAKPAAARWFGAMYLPRALSRATLEIVSVRVENLWDITEDDARREGCDELYLHMKVGEFTTTDPEQLGKLGCRASYAKLWDEINDLPTHSWKMNPKVYRIEFKRRAENTLKLDAIEQEKAEAKAA